MAWASYAQSARTAFQGLGGGDKELHSSDFVPDLASLQDALIKYLLQEFRSSRGEDESTEGLSDTDRDALDITRLLSTLQSDQHGLERLLNGSAVASNGLDSGTPLSLLPGDSVQQLRAPKAPRTSCFGDEVGQPVLNIPALDIGLEEGLVQELSYQLFLGTCGQECSPDTLQSMRRHLQIGQTRGQELQRVTATAATLVSSNAMERAPSSDIAAAGNLASLYTQASLLKRLKPTDFQSYAAFAAWRGDIVQLLLSVLALASQEIARKNSRLASSCRMLMARLKGGLRRVNIPSAEEFEDAEYTEATESVFKAVSALASQSTSGWAFPWALRVQLAQTTLSGMFSSSGPGYVAQHDVLLQAITHNLWPILGITSPVADGLWVWMHFCEFTAKGDTDLLDSVEAGLERLQQNNSENPAQGLWDTPAPPEESGFGDEVAASIVEWICERLSDYHANFHDSPTIMQGLVNILCKALQVKKSQSGESSESPIQQVVGVCLRSSLTAAYMRVADAAAADSNNKVEELTAIARAAGALLRAERTVFSSILEPCLPDADRAAAATLYTLYGRQLKPYLAKATTLEDGVVEVLRAAQRLEAQFGVSVEPKQPKMRPSMAAEAPKPARPWGPRPPPPSWELDAAVSRLSETWCDAQLAQVHSWMVRLLEKEDWKPVHQEKSCAAIAVEVNLFLENMIEALMDMQLRVPVSMVEHITAGIDDAVQKLVSFVLQAVGNADMLVPPVPPMTRFKKQVAAKAAQADVAGTHPRAHSLTVQGSGMLSFTQGHAPQPDMERHAARVAALSTESLVVRLNSFARLLDALGVQEKLLRDWWQQIHADAAQMPAEVGGTPGDRVHFSWVKGMFDTAIELLNRGLESLCTFIGIKVIFWDLRTELLENLYKHSVEACRLEPILESIDNDHLGVLVEMAAPGLQPLLARGLLTALEQALRRVYLDGGPYRLFTPSDAPLLMEDLEAAKALFHADGQGLPADQIGNVCQDLGQILYVMQMDVSSVTERLEASQGSQGALANGGTTKPAAYDPEVLLRILSHRAEHAASKYLKNNYKLPKKLEESSLERLKSKLTSRPSQRIP